MSKSDLTQHHMDIPEERWSLLAKIASLYYEKNLTQADIARQLNISRPQVSRLLAEGREAGVVKIIIRYPPDKHYSLRQNLVDKFNLKDAFLVASGNLGYTQLIERLGEEAARHLEARLQDGITLGISWNTGVYHVVNALQSARRKGVTVVQLTGSVGSVNPLVNGPDLTRWLAQTLGAQYHYLPAPLVVESPETRQALMQDRAIREPMALIEHVDIALVGIGGLSPALSSLLAAGYISEAELREIVRQGGVGDICSYHYDLHGHILPLELHQRIIGVNLEILKKIPYVIGVAGGIDKATSILGALRTGVIDCLVTDDMAARTVLKMDES